MTWVDIALLVILGLSALIGVWRGLISEVMALAAWIVATWLAIAFGDSVSMLYEGWVGTPTARWFLGYASVFIAVLLVGGVLTWFMRMLVRSTGLSGTERMLGLGFGLLRGAAIACVLVLVLGFTPMPQEAAWRNAQLLPGFQHGAEWMRTRLPQAVASQSWLDPLRATLAAQVRNSENGSGSKADQGGQTSSLNPAPAQDKPGR